MNTLLNFYRIVSSGLIAVIWIKFYRKVDSLIILYLVYSVFSVICVYVNGGDMIDTFISIFTMLSLILLICMSLEASKKAWMKAMFYIILTFTIIQIVSLLMLPNGLNNGTNESRIHFLGKDNEISLFIALAFLICLSYIRYFGRDRLAKACMFFLVCMELYFASGCGIVITLFLLGMILLRKIIEKSNIITVFNAIITGLIANYLLLFLNAQSYFTLFIQNVLHKDLTLSTRTRIWSTAISLIEKNPIFGTGTSSVSVQGWRIQTYSHNAFLDIGVNFGFVGILLFMVILLYIAIYCKTHKIDSDEQYILATGLFAAFIFTLVEGAAYRTEFITIIAFSYYISKYTYFEEQKGYIRI